ncbi:MAG: hypothetical protein ACLR0V_08545 [Roseburia hominis]
MARLSAEEMFKNMIGRKDEEPQPAQETAAAPTAEKKKASTVQVTVRLRPSSISSSRRQPSTATAICPSWYGRHSISFLRNCRKY